MKIQFWFRLSEHHRLGNRSFELPNQHRATIFASSPFRIRIMPSELGINCVTYKPQLVRRHRPFASHASRTVLHAAHFYYYTVRRAETELGSFHFTSEIIYSTHRNSIRNLHRNLWHDMRQFIESAASRQKMAK